jgi:hypothetical protein
MRQSGFSEAGGFDIVPVPGGFRLVDQPGFNCWGIRPTLFRTAELAADHAWHCLDFKEDRRSTIPAPVTGFEEQAK